MLRKPLTATDDDTEEAPWMVMGTPQSDGVDGFYSAVRNELHARRHPLFVAMMLPIRYQPIPEGEIETLAPDVLVAAVPVHPRSSYNVEAEGVAPAFVLEIVSPESRNRDLQTKPERYERMGVREYAIFAPETADGLLLMHPPLQGYRLNSPVGIFTKWEADAHGRLYSEVLELWLVVRDGELRGQRLDGSWVPILEEETRARQAEARARQAAEARAREAEARTREVESELARLREALALREEA